MGGMPWQVYSGNPSWASLPAMRTLTAPGGFGTIRRCVGSSAGHYERACYHPLLLFNQFGDLETLNMTVRISSVDGLRCLAVLAVLAFHISPTNVTGGYLGVDLFFVISGFVVTKTLTENRPAIRKFYLRRFYRLAPSAAITVIATLVIYRQIGDGILTPSDIESATSTLIAASNVYFMRHSSYFDATLQDNPFLHFWSLSVEEQFYVIWPVTLAVIGGYNFLKKCFFVIFLAFISLFIFIVHTNAAFYLMPARAYQFCTGALICIGMKERGWRLSSFWLYGSVISSIVVFLINDEKQEWIYGGLAPTTIFALSVLSAASAPRNWMLGFAPVQWIGRASYSIYLIHWPIIVATYIIYSRTVEAQLLAAALSIFGGFMLYFWVERPFNHQPEKAVIDSRFLRISASTGAPALGIFTLIFVGYLGWTYHPHQTSPIIDAPVSASDSANGTSFDETKQYRDEAIKKWVQCFTFEVGRLQGDKRYKLVADLDIGHCTHGKDLILADSTGLVAVPFIATIYKNSDFAQLNSPGCQMQVESKSDDCGKMNLLRLSLLTAEGCRYGHVFLAFDWTSYNATQLNLLFEKIASSGCSFVVLDQLPRFVQIPSRIIAAGAGSQLNLRRYLAFGLDDAKKSLVTIAKDHRNISLLDWSPLNWSGALPATTEAGEPIYSDDYHYTWAGIEWLIKGYFKNVVSLQP
jgi:peptidoglycan/LPS O-acetylase OafA/YrhL